MGTRLRSPRTLIAALGVGATWTALAGGSIPAVAIANIPYAVPAATVTIQTVYENSPISVNMSDAVGYELTNNTGSTETVSFTDTLPPGVALDNPAAVTNTPGTGTCVLESATANPGVGSVTLIVQLASVSASGAVCTISAGIVPADASHADVPLTDTYGSVSAKPTATVTPIAGGLIVLPDPSLTVTAPADGQVFTLGELFDAGFSCAATDPLDSVDSFFGTDDRGNQIASGEPIDTVDPGSHTLEIECYSAAGGGYVSQTVDYSVGSYSVTDVRATKAGRVSFRALVPAGKIVAKVLDGKQVIGTSTQTVTALKSVTTTVKPTAAGLRALRSIQGNSVRLKLEAAFTPAAVGTGDAEITPTAPIAVTRSNIKLVLSTIKKGRR